MILVQILCTVTFLFAFTNAVTTWNMETWKHKHAHSKCGTAKIRNNPVRGYVNMGTRSVKGYYPWMVALYYNNKFTCGGSLISKRYVLTGAQCFDRLTDNLDKIVAVLGDYDRSRDEGTEQKVAIKKIVIHENYTNPIRDNDIALIELAEDAKLSRYIETICLPQAGEEKQAGSMCWMSGWGKLFMTGGTVNILQEASVPVVDNQTCHKRQTNKDKGYYITEKMMCTGYDNGISWVSACSGDAGAPLSCETGNKTWKLFGVISWGSLSCNGLEMYTVSTKVSAYLDWIKESMS